MTRLTMRWRYGDSAASAPWAFAPVRLLGGQGETVLAPGESVDVAEKSIRAIVDVPGFQVYEQLIEVPPTGDFTVELDGMSLVARPGSGGRIGEDPSAPARTRRIAVSIAPWAGPNVTELSADPTIGLTWAHQGVTIARGSNSALPLAMEVATRYMPRRQLAIPPLGWSDSCELIWHQTQDSVPRPRIEPANVGGQLLMRYLLTGQYSLAAAAARAVEAARAAESLTAWSASSYTQLLIGYAYALSWDTARLGAWCRRTAAADTLGTDGLILEAEAAWQRSSACTALDLLATAAGHAPPTLTFGAEMGLRLASVIPATIETASGANQVSANAIDYNAVGPASQDLVRIMNDWLRLMTRADANAASVSTPQTGNTIPDLSRGSLFRRLRWLTRYWLSVWWAYDRVLRPGSTDSAFRVVNKRRFSMTAPTKPESSAVNAATAHATASGSPFRRMVALCVSLLLAAIWVVASISYARRDASVQTDLIYGSIQALTFTAVGAAGVGWLLNIRLAVAEQRALVAEQLAERHRSDAAKGRALAAALQAGDVPAGDAALGADVRRQQAEFSRRLFGELVVQSSTSGDASTGS